MGEFTAAPDTSSVEVKLVVTIFCESRIRTETMPGGDHEKSLYTISSLVKV